MTGVHKIKIKNIYKRDQPFDKLSSCPLYSGIWIWRVLSPQETHPYLLERDRPFYTLKEQFHSSSPRASQGQ